MPKVSPIQSSFIGGEVSPLFYGNVESDRYKVSLARCYNFIPTIQGALIRRPGTKYLSGIKDHNSKAILVRFVFSQDDAMVLEFGDQYIRFFRDQAHVVSGMTIYELDAGDGVPYLEADLPQLHFAQSGDVLYIVHPAYQPRKLIRSADNSWALEIINFKDGPYLPLNQTSQKLYGISLGGANMYTIKSSFSAGPFTIPTGFVGDVGRFIRIKSGTGWSFMKITGVTSTDEVTAEVLGTLAPPVLADATTTWHLGLWSPTTGYPKSVTFFEDRLVFGGHLIETERIDMSRTSDFENFSPTHEDGSSAGGSYAVNTYLNSNDTNPVEWVASDERGLLIGTGGGEWLLTLTSGLPTYRQVSYYGCAPASPLQVGKSTIFIQKANRKVRDLNYSYQIDSFQSLDLTQLASHLTETGVIQMAFQREPQPIVWALRNDGKLIAMTFEKGEETVKVAWHQHAIGGDGVVESICVIPTSDGFSEELWMVVNRTIDGVTRRYIEVTAQYFEDTVAIEEAFFLDSGLTFDNPTLTITGLDHLEGETVGVLVDGAVHSDQTVDSGAITLERTGDVVHVGYRFSSEGQTLRLEAGAADGTSIGKTRRTHRVGFMLHRTVGFKYGVNFEEMEEVPFRTSAQDTDEAIPPFSGIISEQLPADYDFQNQICWKQDEPLPCTLLAVMPQLMTQDRG